MYLSSKWKDDCPAEHEYNVLVVGDPGVGKSSLVRHYVDGFVNLSSVQPTTGFDYETKWTTIARKPVKVRIWDTSGDEKYNIQNQMHFKNKQLDGVIFVYDVTNTASFNNVNKWYQELDPETRSDLTTMLVGNKGDLENKIAVQQYRAKDAAIEVSPICGYWEVSAKTGRNVTEAFNMLLKIMYKEQEDPEEVFTSYGRLAPELHPKAKSGTKEVYPHVRD